MHETVFGTIAHATNPFEPPKEVNDVAEVSLPVRVLLPWPMLGYWLIAFFLPTMLALAGAIDHVTGLRYLDRPGMGGFVYLVPLVPLGLCWLVTLTAKASLATKLGWFVFTPIILAAQIGLLVLVSAFLLLTLDGLHGIQ